MLKFSKEKTAKILGEEEPTNFEFGEDPKDMQSEFESSDNDIDFIDDQANTARRVVMAF